MIINVTMSSLVLMIIIVELPYAVCHFNILSSNSDVLKSVKCVYFLFINPYVCIILQIVLMNVTIIQGGIYSICV